MGDLVSREAVLRILSDCASDWPFFEIASGYGGIRCQKNACIWREGNAVG